MPQPITEPIQPPVQPVEHFSHAVFPPGLQQPQLLPVQNQSMPQPVPGVQPPSIGFSHPPLPPAVPEATREHGHGMIPGYTSASLHQPSLVDEPGFNKVCLLISTCLLQTF